MIPIGASAYEPGSDVTVEVAGLARGLIGGLELLDRGIDGVFSDEILRAVAWVKEPANPTERGHRLAVLLAALCRISVTFGRIVDQLVDGTGSLMHSLNALEEIDVTFSLPQVPRF
jgi:hypothetical protein